VSLTPYPTVYRSADRAAQGRTDGMKSERIEESLCLCQLTSVCSDEDPANTRDQTQALAPHTEAARPHSLAQGPLHRHGV
jgi:hypothetical protein